MYPTESNRIHQKAAFGHQASGVGHISSIGQDKVSESPEQAVTESLLSAALVTVLTCSVVNRHEGPTSRVTAVLLPSQQTQR